jgi:hypothetical protein
MGSLSGQGYRQVPNFLRTGIPPQRSRPEHTGKPRQRALAMSLLPSPFPSFPVSSLSDFRIVTRSKRSRCTETSFRHRTAARKTCCHSVRPRDVAIEVPRSVARTPSVNVVKTGVTCGGQGSSCHGGDLVRHVALWLHEFSQGRLGLGPGLLMPGAGGRTLSSAVVSLGHPLRGPGSISPPIADWSGAGTVWQSGGVQGGAARRFGFTDIGGRT